MKNKNLIDPEEIYQQERDNSNFIIGMMFGGVFVFCLVVIYVCSLLEKLMY